ncbi:hypothetical protein ACFV7Q_33975 [Streptomyces sp. NPDC059851]|uniref:hypothetical protein n=1 Tax=Streptomyces sp. NPDC059851 TaxID=3346971 RepID=UPI00366634A6
MAGIAGTGTTDAAGRPACPDADTVAQARRLLAEGQGPVGVFAGLALRSGDRPAAVWAVCRALGVPDARVRERLGRVAEALFAEYGPDEEESVGELLELLGVFDVPRTLDGHEQEVLGLLKTAGAALGGISSGVAHGLSRRFVKGELTAAFLLLARQPVRQPRGNAATFWGTLAAAGALLPPPADPGTAAQVAQVLAECRRHTAEAH